MSGGEQFGTEKSIYYNYILQLSENKSNSKKKIKLMHTLNFQSVERISSFVLEEMWNQPKAGGL